MDLVKDNISGLYRKYLLSALGSALIISIYSTVDMICVGQYEGSFGSAALSVVMPIWSIIISLGILIGVGGAVHFGVARGEGREHTAKTYFTVSFISGAVLCVIVTALLVIYLQPLMRFFGADEKLLPYAVKYASSIAWATPAFLLGGVLGAFVRADGAPALAMLSVIGGGIINSILDVSLVFWCDWGIYGAGLATAIGQYVALLILFIHFFRKNCGLKFGISESPALPFFKTLATGFSPFITDISFGITVIMFNNQIMRFSGSDELAVYGVIANLHILIQALFYGVGEAVQPICSANFGAGSLERVRYTLKRGIISSLIIGMIFFILLMAFPRLITSLYMSATPHILDICAPAFRAYSSAFLFMGINIVVSYYLQSVLKTWQSILTSLLRGLIFSTLLIFALPAIFGFEGLWFAFAAAELLTAIFSAIFVIPRKKA